MLTVQKHINPGTKKTVKVVQNRSCMASLRNCRLQQLLKAGAAPLYSMFAFTLPVVSLE